MPCGDEDTGVHNVGRSSGSREWAGMGREVSSTGRYHTVLIGRTYGHSKIDPRPVNRNAPDRGRVYDTVGLPGLGP